MSYKRLDAEDFLVSVDSITSTVWSDNAPTLTTFFTASTNDASSNDAFYRNVYKTAASESIQFAIAYGDMDGSGSLLYNSLVDGNSPSKTVYGQFRNLVYGDENTDFSFEGTTPKNIWAVSVERARYKEKLMPGTLNLKLTSGSVNLELTDNSAMVTTDTFLECGRVYQLISGSNGTAFAGDGHSASNGSYGLFLPDVSLIILNPLAVAEKLPLATTDRTSDIAGDNIGQAVRLFKDGASFGLNSEETLTSDFVFVRARNSEFNYSENPSFISGSTGDVLYSSMINSPQSFLTTVGLYNDTNELLAVAKLSKPLTKDFTKETLLRVKLDF